MKGAEIGRFNAGGVTVAGTSAVTITSGTIDTSNGAIILQLKSMSISNSAAQMNLNGGVWMTNSPQITTNTNLNSGTNNRLEVNFNGGTFRTSNSGAGVTIMPTTLTAVTLNAGGGTFDIGTLSSGANTIAATIIGVGGLTKTGAGTLALTATNNSYSGTTSVSGGALQVGDGASLAGSLPGNVVLLNTSTLAFNSTANQAYAGVISGTGILTKSGAGTLTLSGSGSTFTGALTQSAGGIINTGSFASGGFAVTSGSFLNNNRMTQTAGVFEVNGASASFDNTGVITGAAGNFLVRLGSMTNSGTITGFGSTFGVGTATGAVDTSRSAPATLTNLASGSMSVGGGNIGREYFATLTNAGYLQMGGANIGRANSGVTVAGTTAVTITSGTIDTAAGGIVLRLRDMNISNSTVQMNLNGGVWMTSNPGITVDTTANSGTNNRFEVNFNGGTFRTSNGSGATIMPTQLTAVTLNAGGGTFDIGTLSGANTIAATIIGVGGLTKTGAGTLALTGSNSFAGTTRIAAGGLSIGNADALRNSTLDLATADTGTISAIGQNSTLGGLSGSRNLDMLTRTLSIGNNNSSTTYSGNLSNGALTKIGSGVLSLTGSNDFTGLATVSAGTIDFNTINALRNASGVNIAGGAGLRYSGGAASFDRNISVTSGTGTVTNSGGGLLTLAGTLTKDGTVLRLTGGQFNVTGQIVGASANSDLVVDGTSTVTLSSANTYNGPTFVNQASTLVLGTNNAIPNNSVVTLGDATTAGTLNMNGFTNDVGGLAFGAGGGTLRLAATSTSAAPLTASAGTVNLNNGTLNLAGSGTSAGLYRLISAQTVSGSFASVTNGNAGYQLLTTATSVNYQQRAVLGAVSVTNPAAIITGGSAAFSYTVANNALSGGADLGFSSGSLSNLIGSSSGTAAAGGSSSSISGLVFTGTSIGNNQQGTFTVTAPDAFGSTTASGTVGVTVLDHATASLAGSLLTSTTVSLGTYNYSTNTWESGGATGFFDIYNIASAFGAGLTADLSLVNVTGAANGFTTNLVSSYADIAGGNSQQFSIFFNPTGFTSGQSAMFTITTSDKTGMAGATASNTLYVTASVIVVPEPGAIVLAGLGIGLAGWMALRRKRK